MKAKNKITTITLLSAGAMAGTVLTNKYIKFLATSKNMLPQSDSYQYKWRFGNISYKKTGSGKPLLLIHDLDYASSGCEWENIVSSLEKNHTVYNLDLLGCGRSEKPNLTYTNFLYVQLLNDFIKSEIGHRTDVIVTGASSSLVIMACQYNMELFDQIMLINPENPAICSLKPGKFAKLYKLILDIPIIGTLLYHIASSKENITEAFENKYFENIYDAKTRYIEKYYEAAHLGESPKSMYASIQCNYTKCNINYSLEKINNSIYILGGEYEPAIKETINAYMQINPSIEYAVIPGTKHLPQLEDPKEVLTQIHTFFN